MKHTLIRDPHLNGWEYGMLRSFENAIIEETGAAIVEIPDYKFAGGYSHYFGHGTNKGKYRKYFSRQNYSITGDIAWYILMGPENYRLDLFKNWGRDCKTKILYIYDTLPAQYELIKKLFSNNDWDILITSFNDAVEDLERLTGRKWHCIPQAADFLRFQPLPFEERVIHFSAYGRRYPVLHEVVKEFCQINHLYYDYTTHDARHPVVPAEELYKQYGWHLNHSLFTFSWPVELTNPLRAGHLRPITCRWFEAAAGGTIILGRPPDNSLFDNWLSPGIVTNLDPHSDRSELFFELENIWDQRKFLFDRAEVIRRQNIERWTWNNRVKEIINLLK